MKIKCYRSNSAIENGIEIPTKSTEESSGFDIQALITYGEDFILSKGSIIVSTGLSFDIPKGYEIQIRPRSGLTFKHNIIAGFGTIDSDYTGEVKVKLFNLGHDEYYVKNGDRIAQAVIKKLPEVEMIEGVGDIKETARGIGGFGHTGV
jgi:dUTP pyrophosphatase